MVIPVPHDLFRDNYNKRLSPLIVAGMVVGAATLAGGVAFAIRQKNIRGTLIGVAGTFGAISLEAEAMDILSGKPLPMLPGAELLKAFTTQPGAVTKQLNASMQEQWLEQGRNAIPSSWLDDVMSEKV